MDKPTKIIIGIIVAIIVIAGIWYGVSKKPAAPTTKEPIKIGATLPLTGQMSTFGVDVKNAVELAIKEINEGGGIDGRQIKVIYEDDQCDPKLSVTTVNKLMNVDGVKVIIGPFCSGASLSAAPVAQEKKVLLLSGSATNPKLADYNLFFRTIPSDAYQGMFGADYVFNKLGKRRVAIAYAQNDYCVGLKDVFKKRFTELGGKIVIETEHQEKATDLRTQITKIKNTDAEIVYLIAYPTDAGHFLKQAKELGLNLPIFSPEVMEDPDVIKIAKEAAEGVLFTRAKEIKNEEFLNKYKSVYGKEPGAYDAFYYDGVKIIGGALKRCNEDVDCIRNYLVNLKDYPGVSGKINFNENGDLVGAEFMIKTIKNGQFVPYEE
jgi:branched-chain amino acid transport system substrate-binding protein